VRKAVCADQFLSDRPWMVPSTIRPIVERAPAGALLLSTVGLSREK